MGRPPRRRRDRENNNSPDEYVLEVKRLLHDVRLAGRTGDRLYNPGDAAALTNTVVDEEVMLAIEALQEGIPRRRWRVDGSVTYGGTTYE